MGALVLVVGVMYPLLVLNVIASREEYPVSDPQPDPEPDLPEPTPTPMDNDDLQCICKHWLTEHSPKDDDQRGGETEGFGSFVTCDVCEECPGFNWDAEHTRPFPGG